MLSLLGLEHIWIQLLSQLFKPVYIDAYLAESDFALFSSGAWTSLFNGLSGLLLDQSFKIGQFLLLQLLIFLVLQKLRPHFFLYFELVPFDLIFFILSETVKEALLYFGDVV